MNYRYLSDECPDEGVCKLSNNSIPSLSIKSSILIENKGQIKSKDLSEFVTSKLHRLE